MSNVQEDYVVFFPGSRKYVGPDGTIVSKINEARVFNDLNPNDMSSCTIDAIGAVLQLVELSTQRVVNVVLTEEERKQQQLQLDNERRSNHRRLLRKNIEDLIVSGKLSPELRELASKFVTLDELQ